MWPGYISYLKKKANHSLVPLDSKQFVILFTGRRSIRRQADPWGRDHHD